MRSKLSPVVFGASALSCKIITNCPHKYLHLSAEITTGCIQSKHKKYNLLYLFIINMAADEGIRRFFESPLINHTINSSVPDICKSGPCILGIDEAGRGPVLGPMVYSVAYYLEKRRDDLSKMKFADSKTLTENDREKLFKQIGTTSCEHLGWIVIVLSPNMISNSMLRR